MYYISFINLYITLNLINQFIMQELNPEFVNSIN